MEILPWTPPQLFPTHNFLPCSLFAHNFFSMNNTFSHITIILFFHIILLILLLKKTHKLLPLGKPLWPLLELVPLVQWKYWNPSLQSMASSSFMNEWESRMIFFPMEFRMRILMPNETLRRFHSPSNWMIMPMTNGIGGFIFFSILDILMGFLSSIIINFIRSTLTSYFFILITLS